MSRRFAPTGWLLVLGLVATSACDRTRIVEPTEIRPGSGSATTRFGATTAERFAWARSMETSAPKGELEWTAPESWRPLPKSQFRQANFALDGGAYCWLTELPGGVSILGNVNRWRGQMGLSPWSDAQLGSAETVRLLGADAPVVDLTGPYSTGGMSAQPGDLEDARMLATIRGSTVRTITVKLVGPPAAVEAARAGFLAFCESIRADGESVAESTDDDVPIEPNESADGRTVHPGTGISWAVPSGWVATEAHPMRLVTLHPIQEPSAECRLSVFGGTVAANLNRWLGQFGKPALDDDGIAALPEIEVLGQPTKLLEAEGTFRGMSGGAQDGRALLGVVCPTQGGMNLFVKMVGPADVVRAEKGRFLELCASIGQ